METSQVRAIITTEASITPGAQLWPNRLGFDVAEWQYCVNEQKTGNPWTALRRSQSNDEPSLYGEGPTIAQARANARPMPE